MAARGKASVSSSGASMSQYDVEVEARLKALEAKAHTPCGGSGGVDGNKVAELEAKLNTLIQILNDNPLVVQNCKKNEEGKRQLPL